MTPGRTESDVEISSSRDGVTSSFDTEGREFHDRTWGDCAALDDKVPNYMVKCVAVLSDKRLSRQRHTLRAEH